MNAGSKLAFLATFIAAAGCTVLMTVTTQFRVLLEASAALVNSETLIVMAVLGQIVLAVVTVLIASIVAQVAFRQAVDELRRDIALRRLVGSRRRDERRRLFGGFSATGAVGAAAGWAAGAILGAIVGLVLRQQRAEWHGVAIPWVDPVALIPAAAIVLGALAAAWGASRRVLQIAPAEAVRTAVQDEDLGAGRRRPLAWTLVVTGSAVLLASLAGGFLTPLAVLPGVLGGALSVLGIVALATPLTQGLLRLAAPAARKSTELSIALGSLQRSPKRTGGIAIALMVGVAVVTMFSVAGETALIAMDRAAGGDGMSETQREFLGEIAAQFMTVIALAVGGASLIAVFGFVSTMQMSVASRTREIGLLRLVGMSVQRAKRTVLIEAALIGALALASGFVLGLVYGWFGASMMFGSYPGMGVLMPAVPWLLPVLLAVATLAVALGAGYPAARRAGRIRALEAVAVA